MNSSLIMLKSSFYTFYLMLFVGVKATSVTAEVVPCTTLSMTFFDRLQDDNVVRESGAIQKCFDEYYQDMVVSDELRKVLITG